jgi:hypothetical protein
MKFKRRIAFPVLALLLSILACAAPATSLPAPDSNQLNTAVALTVNAAITLSLVPHGPLPTDTPASAISPEAPSLTSTETFTPTAMITFTPLVPMISVSVDTNCRSGPGKDYEYRGALLAGKTAEVIAREQSGNYWYIPNPDSDGNFCWVWGEYAIVTGNIAVLPIYTALPSPSPTITPSPTYTLTPVPAIKASLSKMETCSGKWWVNIKIKNIGGVSFKSYDISVTDTKTKVTQTDHADVFRDKEGCSVPTLNYVFSPGGTYSLSTPSFAKNLSEHNLNITLTLCAGLKQTGQCITEKVSVKP